MIFTLTFHEFLHTMYKYVLNSVVKISMMFAKYFEYYTIILRGAFFRGHAVEKCKFWNFRSPVTLTLDRVIRHTVVHQSSTSIYPPNLTEIGKTYCGRMYVQTYLLMDGYFPL